ncbi:MAG: AsnC family transcriptional regulator [Thaumarchaeota archaeon]|nr:AsnC family transcriptional regulator [Nitrososphaerota archaeon]|tara:strand:+ start:1950 stop:2180 length:231 start_codon:yes stop_codon:yes gene_type:complete
MPTALVLLNVDLGDEEKILERIRKIDGVREAYRVYGIYDMILKIEGDLTEDMKTIITEKIRRIQGVRSTLSLVSLQ